MDAGVFEAEVGGGGISGGEDDFVDADGFFGTAAEENNFFADAIFGEKGDARLGEDGDA